jgi:flagellin-specific chaperone FliS
MARNYNMPDDDMLEYNRDMRAIFITHKAEFITWDTAVFSDPFADDWLTAIEAAEGAQTDEERDDEQTGLTAIVQEQMFLSRKKHAQVKYYVNKAFENNPSARNEFGLDDYDEAAQSQKKMVTFLARQFRLANGKYKTQMLAAGFTQPMIDELEDMWKELAQENTDQNVFVKTTTLDTQAREAVMNTAHAFARKVNAASKAMYYDDVIKQNLYLFPRSDESAQSFSLVGNVSEQGTGNLMKNVSVQVMQNGIVRKTDAQGEYGVAGLGAGTFTLQFTRTGYQPLTLDVTITDPLTPTVLNAVMVPL